MPPDTPTDAPASQSRPDTSDCRIETFTLGPFETNCSVVRVGASTGCWIIDAGYEPGELIGYARQAGPLGLYPEQRCTISGRPLGNYPQAYSHLALINACCRLGT